MNEQLKDKLYNLLNSYENPEDWNEWDKIDWKKEFYCMLNKIRHDMC